jgi:hypothetical protein
MKKMFLFVVAFATIVLLPSCAVKSTYSTVKTLEIRDYGVISKPVLADLNVSETKVTGSAIGTKDNSSEAIKNERFFYHYKKNSKQFLRI